MAIIENKANSLKKTARLAGLLYFIWVLTGIYSMMFLPSKIIVKGDAVATANKILANEFLFRIGIINDLFSATICVFMLLVLYRLFKHVNEGQAKLMVILFFLTLPVVFIMGAFNITTLMILKGEILKTFELSHRQDLAMLFLNINNYGTLTIQLFWGLWLIPFGQLVYKSGFIPRIIGVFLFLNGAAYILSCFTSLLFPNYQTLVSQFAMPFYILGEISITLWLLIKGIKNNLSTIEIQ